jgi:hypothetical protein
MSTKTSIKRIAAVAAVALTLGGFSAVSAHAAVYAENLSLSSNTSSVTAGSAATVAVSNAFLSAAGNETMTATAFIVSSPTGSTATLSATATAGQNTANTAGNARLSLGTAGSAVTNAVGAIASGAATGAYTLNLTPLVAGTYVIKVVPTDSGTSAATQTWTITAAAKPALNAAASTAYTQYSYCAFAAVVNHSFDCSNGSGFVAANATTDAETHACFASTPTSATWTGGGCAEITVTESNGSTTSPLVAGDAEPLAVVVSGPALATVNGDAGGFVSGVVGGGLFLESSAQNTTLGLTKYVYVYSNGIPGVATITIKGSVSGTVLATKSITFFGTAKNIKTTVVNSVIQPVVPASSTWANTGAVTATVTDASGVGVSAYPVYLSSGDTTVINNTNLLAYTDRNGVATFDLTGVKAGTADVTVTNLSSSADTATPLGGIAPASIRVGDGVVTKVVLSADSDSYVPGQLATITATLTDKNGLPVPNGVYTVFTGVPSSSLALSAGSVAGAISASSSRPAAAAGQIYVGNNLGTATFTVNMPVSAGTLTITPTASATTISVSPLTVTVGAGAVGDSAQAAIDAAQEATDAANAAYDAANNAMDSADAATAAAQDASDNASAALAAVTELSATVAKLVASVNSIASALASIKKKLGVK